jgi:dTDP-4-dehydrorhamnose 3,5-epimerase
MIFTPTKLVGAYLIEPEKKYDARGFFARVWCQKEFAEHDLTSHLVQINISYNKHWGTLRGMHYQVEPFQESKLVRCTRGAIYDVIIDLRQESPSYRQWLGVKLTADDHKMLYVPEGFAHGFQTLEDDTEVVYQVSAFYAPQSEAGVRYDDPGFGIVWPLEVQVISDKDRNWADYVG